MPSRSGGRLVGWLVCRQAGGMVPEPFPGCVGIVPESCLNIRWTDFLKRTDEQTSSEKKTDERTSGPKHCYRGKGQKAVHKAVWGQDQIYPPVLGPKSLDQRFVDDLGMVRK